MPKLTKRANLYGRADRPFAFKNVSRKLLLLAQKKIKVKRLNILISFSAQSHIYISSSVGFCRNFFGGFVKILLKNKDFQLIANLCLEIRTQKQYLIHKKWSTKIIDRIKDRMRLNLMFRCHKKYREKDNKGYKKRI